MHLLICYGVMFDIDLCLKSGYLLLSQAPRKAPIATTAIKTMSFI